MPCVILIIVYLHGGTKHAAFSRKYEEKLLSVIENDRTVTVSIDTYARRWVTLNYHRYIEEREFID